MSTVNRSSVNYLMHVGVSMVTGLEMREEQDEWLALFDKRSSTRAYEETVMMSGPAFAPIIEEDNPIEFGKMRTSWKHIVEHDKYGLALRFTPEARDDNQYMALIPAGGKRLARSMRATRAARAARIFNLSTDPNVTYGDRKPLLAVDHPLDAQHGGTFSNTLAGNPELAEDTLEDLVTLADYAVDQAGIPANLEPRYLAIATALKFKAHRIINSMQRSKTADNDANAIKDMGLFRGAPVKLRYVANQKFWGFTTTGSDGDGLIFWERWPMRRGEDTEFSTGAFLYKCECRDSFMSHDPRNFYGSYPA